MKDDEYAAFMHKIEEYGKNANRQINYLVPHLNDMRGSSVDKDIQAQTDFTFGLMHYRKIVLMLEKLGTDLGLKI